MRRIGLVFGGRSVEHEVSVVSARAVSHAISAAGMQCVPIGVTGEGTWIGPMRSAEVLASDASRVDMDDADTPRVTMVPGNGFLLLGADGRTSRLPLDALFPVVHGWGGEDGRLQGVADLAGVPCVGAGVLGSAAGMDKEVAKRLFESHGIPVVPWVAVDRRSVDLNFEQVAERVTALGYPVFVKPANGGSSVGIHRVASPEGLRHAIDDALRHDRKLVVERGVNAREIECAVLGNDEPRVSGAGEIFPAGEFYDYESKYVDASSALAIPAELDPVLTETVRSLALRAYRASELSGLARVDFLVERNGPGVFLNEVNTLPGFTPISMFPKLWEHAGVDFAGLIKELVDLALERGRQEAERATRRGP